MLKRGIAAALASVMVLGLTACGKEPVETGQTDTPATPTGFVETKVEPDSFDSGVELTSDCYRFIYALGNAPATIDAAKFFKMRLEQESGGTLSCDIYTDNVLGSERELLEGCQFGNYDIVLATNATVASFSNDIFCLDIPWLYDNKQQVYEVLDGVLGDTLAEGLEDKGFKLLQWQENSFRTLTTSDREVKSVSDLKGLKIRIMENELQLAQWKNYGANPTPMAFTELFTALQQGTVDGQDNGAELTWQTKFCEVQKYYTYTKHIYSPYVILMSNEKFKSLTPEQQEIVMRVSDEAVAYERERCSEYEAAAIENIKNYPGMTFTELTPEAVEEFKAACVGLKELAYKKVSNPEIIDLLYSEVEKAKAKYPAEGVESAS
ncbi:TRAP transporter substrate-binding protein [Anaerotignum sp. MB30-C6]|uniref:TRAP transporter substrate-binding protein n=1 Tax=Anaerotignum sp. MB30-C6 TaxID=3070814 RepID=UPI0027DB0EED|nr:TRAP transporter substrate-binding protein [Anaerotignum sp. MB30-C6]WMI81283.1 TRAP transporter substrate-binding protein [Anaerotignum sp. MB30-C6]